MTLPNRRIERSVVYSWIRYTSVDSLLLYQSPSILENVVHKDQEKEDKSSKKVDKENRRKGFTSLTGFKSWTERRIVSVG